MALVFAGHLLHYHFRVRVDMQLAGAQRKCVLQGFHQGNVFGHVAVLISDALGDADRPGCAPFDDNSDTRRARVTMRSPIDVSHKIKHSLTMEDERWMRQDSELVPARIHLPWSASVQKFVQNRSRFNNPFIKQQSFQSIALSFPRDVISSICTEMRR